MIVSPLHQTFVLYAGLTTLLPCYPFTSGQEGCDEVGQNCVPLQRTHVGQLLTEGLESASTDAQRSGPMWGLYLVFSHVRIINYIIHYSLQMLSKQIGGGR